MIINGAGEVGKLIKKGVSLLDEKIPYEYTLTGSGLKADLQMFETISMTNPILFEQIFSYIPELFLYFKGARSENDKMKCLTNFISKARPSGNNLIYDFDDTTRLVFRRDCGANAHAIGSKYPSPTNHYNIEIQKFNQNHHQFKTWKDYHLIVDDNNNVIDIYCSK